MATAEPPCEMTKFDSSSERDRIFEEFSADEDLLDKLKDVIFNLDHSSIPFGNVRVLKVVGENARQAASFKFASISIEPFFEEKKKKKKNSDEPEGKKKKKNSDEEKNPDEEGNPKPANPSDVIKYPFGRLFTTGMEILKEFVFNTGIPNDSRTRKALAMLLEFIQTSLTILKPRNTSELKWTVLLAQHLFSLLTVGGHYTLDHKCSYKSEGFDNGKCCCKMKENLKGEFGDTSFGCADAWHGSVDILFENVAIKVLEDAHGDPLEDEHGDPFTVLTRIPSDSSDYGNDSSIEVKLGNREMEDCSQMLSQCIVFSFLQNKMFGHKMKNSMVPSIGVNESMISLSFYDSQNDILLQTAGLDLFLGSILDLRVVVCIWLAMNFRLFGTGPTETMKLYKATFHDRVGNYLEKYQKTVKRGVINRTRGSKPLGKWGNAPGARDERNPSQLVGGYSYLVVPTEKHIEANEEDKNEKEQNNEEDKRWR